MGGIAAGIGSLSHIFINSTSGSGANDNTGFQPARRRYTNLQDTIEHLGTGPGIAIIAPERATFKKRDRGRVPEEISSL